MEFKPGDLVLVKSNGNWPDVDMPVKVKIAEKNSIFLTSDTVQVILLENSQLERASKSTKIWPAGSKVWFDAKDFIKLTRLSKALYGF